jgi:hypothetical protein
MLGKNLYDLCVMWRLYERLAGDGYVGDCL